MIPLTYNYKKCKLTVMSAYKGHEESFGGYEYVH